MGAVIEYMGFFAGMCTTIAFLPQIIKICKERSSSDISTLMYLIFCTGLILWIVYGIYTQSNPLVIANSITLLLAITVLLIKYTMYMKKRKQDKQQ